MAAEISKALNLSATLVPGERGVFDVIVDGRTIFSKHEAHRFPAPGEIVGILERMKD